MPYRISVPERNASLDGLTSLFDKGGRPAVSTMNIYSNATSQPPSPESGVPGGSVLLAQVPFSSDAFAAAASAVATANALPLTSPVLNTGTAGWFRFFTGEASPSALGDGTITANGGGGDATFDNINFVSGGTVSISNLSITQPA